MSKIGGFFKTALGKVAAPAVAEPAAPAPSAAAAAPKSAQVETRQSGGTFRKAIDALADEEGLRKRTGEAKGVGGARKQLLGE